MKIFKLFFCLILVLLVGTLSIACSKDKESNEIQVSHSLNNVSFSKNSERITDQVFLDDLKKASFKLYDILSDDEDENFVISPLSIYLALSLLNAVGDEEVKNEISVLLNLKEEDIINAKLIMNSVIREIKEGNKLVSKVSLTNSIWFDDRDGTIKYNQDVLDELAYNYYCYGYETKFNKENIKANEDIRKFVKENTNGLIDKDFELPVTTLFALINTLYFKDNWNNAGDPISILSNQSFNDILCDFLVGDYIVGLESRDEISRTFYTETATNYKLHFIVPEDGKTLKEVMSGEHLFEILNKKENAVIENDGKYTIHKTRTIFPKFKVASDKDVKKVLVDKGYLSHTFTEYQSELIDVSLMVDAIKHSAILKVDERGVEGAAVTIVANCESAMDITEYVLHDFVVDKSFGFVLTTSDGIVLFMGQITNPNK